MEAARATEANEALSSERPASETKYVASIMSSHGVRDEVFTRALALFVLLQPSLHAQVIFRKEKTHIEELNPRSVLPTTPYCQGARPLGHEVGGEPVPSWRVNIITPAHVNVRFCPCGN